MFLKSNLHPHKIKNKITFVLKEEMCCITGVEQ